MGARDREGKRVNKRLALRGYTYLTDLPWGSGRERREYTVRIATRPALDARLAINEEAVTRRGPHDGKRIRHLYQNGNC